MFSPDAYLLPNLITIGRILLIPLFLYFLLTIQPVFAAVLFLLLSLTDTLDGFLARKFGLESDLGKFLDPIADKILVISALIGLLEIRFIPAIPVILIVARDLIVSAVRLSAAKEGLVIAASPWGKAKTVLQVLAIFMLILNLPYAVPVLWFSVLLTLVSGVDYLVRR